MGIILAVGGWWRAFLSIQSFISWWCAGMHGMLPVGGGGARVYFMVMCSLCLMSPVGGGVHYFTNNCTFKWWCAGIGTCGWWRAFFYKSNILPGGPVWCAGFFVIFLVQVVDAFFENTFSMWCAGILLPVGGGGHYFQYNSFTCGWWRALLSIQSFISWWCVGMHGMLPVGGGGAWVFHGHV